jgi:tetratricopeptide (TPR) repeat protein
VLRGHAFYLLDNLFDSEESYINALRIKPAPKDPILQERLGIVYAKRQSWTDAKTVFLKVCKEKVSTNAWYYLGLSLLRLGELEASEDAISQANILDNQDASIWGLNAILCLKYGKQRLPQAKFCMKEALRLGLKDTALLEEIADLFEHEGLLAESARLYETVSSLIQSEQETAQAEHAQKRDRAASEEKQQSIAACEEKMLKLLDEKHGIILQKLGNIYCNEKLDKGGDAHNVELAIEHFKRAIDLVKGDSNKTNIALTLQTLLTR